MSINFKKTIDKLTNGKYNNDMVNISRKERRDTMDNFEELIEKIQYLSEQQKKIAAAYIQGYLAALTGTEKKVG